MYRSSGEKVLIPRNATVQRSEVVRGIPTRVGARVEWGGDPCGILSGGQVCPWGVVTLSQGRLITYWNRTHNTYAPTCRRQISQVLRCLLCCPRRKYFVQRECCRRGGNARSDIDIASLVCWG